MYQWLLPALLFFTGTTGLLYEVVLGRFLTLYIGSSGASQAVTLAAFLGGLSGGALLAGRLANKHLSGVRKPLLAYAGLEAVIGLWALLFPSAADAAFGVYDGLAHSFPAGTAANVALKLGFAAMLIVPMTVAMGATLPVLALAVGRAQRADAVRVISRYYAINAAGGAMGCLLAGFALIEAFGLELPLVQAAAINLVVGVIVMMIARRIDEPEADEAELEAKAQVTDAGAPPLSAFVTAAAITGLVTLVYEVVWVRLSGLLLGASVYAFALMLFVVIIGIASGSALTTALIARGLDPRRVFGGSQVLAALMALALAWRLPSMPEELVHLRVALPMEVDHYGDWLLRGGLYLAAHFMPAAIALGASFPALLAGARRSGTLVERATPWLLGSNTLGNLSGAVLGGFALMPLLGLENVLFAGACLSLSLSLLCLPRPVPTKLKGAVVAGVVMIVSLAVVAPPDISLLHRGLYRLRPKRTEPIANQIAFNRGLARVFREDGKDASITVDYHKDSDLLLFRTNGKADGSNRDSVTQVGLGNLGFLFNPSARDVFVVGLGTGQSAAAAAAHPKTNVLVAELSPAVVEVGRLFSRFNHDVMNNPRVDVRVADAREVLRAAEPNSWDVVVSEPSNPWVVGVPDLFTVESYSLVKRALRSKGILVQWLQSYEMSSGVLRRILCTVRSVLPHVAVFRLEYGDLALVASEEPLTLNPRAAQASYMAAEVQQVIQSAANDRIPQTLAQLLSLQLCGPKRVDAICAEFKRPLRIRKPEVEYQAPRDFFAKVWPKEMLAALDTRATAAADTWLADQGTRAVLSPAWRKQVRDFLAAQDVRGERPLVSALSAARADKTIKGLKLAYELPPLAGLDAAQRQQWCQRIASTIPWLIDHFQTQFGPVTDDAAVTAWSRACQPTKP